MSGANKSGNNGPRREALATFRRASDGEPRAVVGLAELARAGTALDERSIDHLHRLVASWAPLADFSFGDLLLYAPCTDGFDPAAVTVAPEQAPDERLSPGRGRGR